MSYSGYDATPGSGLTFGSDLVSGKHYPRTKIAHGAEGTVTDVSTSNPLPVGGAAADDAAAAGNPLPVAGVYQATPDEIDDGDVGRVRLSARRAQVLVPDFRAVYAYSGDVSKAGDMEGSTKNSESGFSAVTAAFFDGGDVGFSADPRWLRVPMGIAGWKEASLIFQNQLGVSVDVTVAAQLYPDGNWLSHYAIFGATVNDYGVFAIAPDTPGSRAVAWQKVEMLRSPMYYLIVSVDPAADPSGGWWSLSIARRA